MIGRYAVFSSAVSCLYHDIQKIERVEMAKYGLKGPHAQCLVVMARHPEGLTAVRICELCEKDKAAVSRIVAELEEAGLLTRCERNGVRYRALLRLTETGMAAAKSVSDRAELAVEQAGAGLNDTQREVFYQVLGLIASNLHTICRDGLKEKE
ncbi:MAG: MarR family transcriptional regulator [Oscillospiraceae bacterium]|nr:MarR family transcriptional regulator [Oscillospiraceae bacterium]